MTTILVDGSANVPTQNESENKMMTTNDALPIRIENNHVIAECGPHLLLLDTGSPTSFGTVEITWRGETIDLRQGPAAFPLASINEAIGMPFDGLIGADLLLNESCLIDVAGGILQWMPVPRPLSSPGSGCSFTQMMNVPIATIQLDGVPRSFAIDTGASRTFVEMEIANGLARVGTFDDFYPGMGTFTADLVEMEVSVAATGVVVPSSISVGVLPESLRFLMDTFGIQGIIGLDVLAMHSFHLNVADGVLSPEIVLRIPSAPPAVGKETNTSEEPWTKPLQQVLSTEEWEYERLLEGPDLSPGVSADSHEIIPSLLFLGSQDAARSVVKDEGIRSVCCCLDNIKENELGEYAANGIDSISMENFHDGSLGLLDPFVENGADFVAQQLRMGKGPVLIHCSVGKTRATSVCAVFLIKYGGLTLRQAMQHMRERRHRAYPILHFWELLLKKEMQLREGQRSLDVEEVRRYHSETIAVEKSEAGGMTYQVSQLVNMGFSEAASLAALQKHGGDMMAAIGELTS